MTEQRTGHLEETKRHGSILFPFNIYRCVIPKDIPSVALHWHKSMELIYIREGSGLVQMGLDTADAEAGHIFVLPPGTLHAIRGLPGQAMHYENILFEPEFLGSGAADLCARQYLIPLSGGQLLQPVRLDPHADGYAEILRCLTTAEDLFHNPCTGYELAVKAAMLQLLYCLIRTQPAPPAPEAPNTARLKQVLQRIQSDYAAPLTVSVMAELCGFSSSHFMRWFRQMTGSSFTVYLNEYRLAAAAERLRLTGDKILTIAQDTGFETLSNFNRQFKERYGITPREYRKPEQETSCDTRT